MKLHYLLWLAFLVLRGQSQPAAPPRPNNYSSRPAGAPAQARITSPEVHPDGRITFRLLAPKANEVALSFGAWNSKPQPMTQDASGLWQMTIGAVEPQIYTYVFLVDGLRILDAANPNLKTGARALDASEVEVPGTPPRFDQVRNVPHGEIHVLQYTSTPLKRLRGLYVYLPPQYATDTRRRFPILYLRHGFGDTEANWSDDGRAGVILENLLAEGQANPMIIVMTNGYTGDTWLNSSSSEAMDTLAAEMFTDVIPLMEKRCRVLPGRENRAIAGLSMGGGQAFTIGLRNLDRFAWVAEFSSGLLSDAQFDLAKHVPGLLDKPEEANRKLKLLYLSCGDADPRIPGHENLSALLKSKGIQHDYLSTPGGHEWVVWRTSLADLMKKLFR